MDEGFFVCRVSSESEGLVAEWRLTSTSRDSAYSEAGQASRMLPGWRNNAVSVSQVTQEEWDALEEKLPDA